MDLEKRTTGGKAGDEIRTHDTHVGNMTADTSQPTVNSELIDSVDAARTTCTSRPHTPIMEPISFERTDISKEPAMNRRRRGLYPKGRRSEEKETHARTEVECDRF